jgi:hypothetical protein
MVETPAMRETFQIIGFSGLAFVVLGWLFVSFRDPSPGRERVEWLTTCSMYLGLLSLFAHLSLRAIERDSHVATVAFGFMFLFFCTGFIVCVAQTFKALRGLATKGADSATN